MYERANKKFFERPQVAKRYRNIEAMLVDPRMELRQIVAKTPPAGRVRPLAYGVYDEPTSLTDPKTEVITSGSVCLIGGAAGSEYGGDTIGILAVDSQAGEMRTFFTSGKFYLPLDHLGDAGASPARVAASAKGSLGGKKAYWLVDLGMVTDQVPAGGGEKYLEIGRFHHDNEGAKPTGIHWGNIFAIVDLEPAHQDAVEPPSEAAISWSATTALFPAVSEVAGLSVDFEVNANSSDPWKEPVVTTVIDAAGTNVSKTGQEFSHTFASAATYTVDITVDGTTYNYEVVVSAGAAPTIALA